jgi:hypothetical protein
MIFCFTAYTATLSHCSYIHENASPARSALSGWLICDSICDMKYAYTVLVPMSFTT